LPPSYNEAINASSSLSGAKTFDYNHPVGMYQQQPQFFYASSYSPNQQQQTMIYSSPLYNVQQPIYTMHPIQQPQPIYALQQQPTFIGMMQQSSNGFLQSMQAPIINRAHSAYSYPIMRQQHQQPHNYKYQMRY
jgi:hypothetical protein